MKLMNTRDVQMVCLDIMKDVHEFCVENNIHYSLSGGSLLGAIRHNGFIPWDDDLDIQMPQQDFDRFIHTYQSRKGYKLFSREISGDNVRTVLTRVCEMDRTYVDTGFLPWCKEKTGIWIDIFMVNGAPNNINKAKFHLFMMKYYTFLFTWERTKYIPFSLIFESNQPLKDKLKFLIKKSCSYLISSNSVDNLLRLKRKFDFESSSYFIAAPNNGLGEWQPVENMLNYQLHKFEDTAFFVMSGYDNNLQKLYGNYMQLPPVEKRVPHHTFNRYYWR